MDTNGFKIVERIDFILKKKGGNRAQIANAIGLKPQNISAWSVRGTIPAGDICFRIADFLGVDCRWLVTGEKLEKEELSDEQKKLLASWEELPENDKAELSMLIDFKLKSSKAKNVQADLA